MNKLTKNFKTKLADKNMNGIIKAGSFAKKHTDVFKQYLHGQESSVDILIKLHDAIIERPDEVKEYMVNKLTTGKLIEHYLYWRRLKFAINLYLLTR